MKRILIALLAFVLFTMGTACGAFPQSSGDIKVIPKPTSGGTAAAGQGNVSNQYDSVKTQNGDLGDKAQSAEQMTENYVKQIIQRRAAEVLADIKAKDWEKLSPLVQPDKGVRFSPYGHVNTDTDLVFSAAQIQNMASDGTKYKWGSFDGSGEPIELDFDGYYKRFIYDHDFMNAKETGYNKVIGKGNTLINSFEVYPGSIMVEYHFPGFDPQYSGMDWSSLRLIFEKKDAVWYLVGIIHDQWTI